MTDAPIPCPCCGLAMTFLDSYGTWIHAEGEDWCPLFGVDLDGTDQIAAWNRRVADENRDDLTVAYLAGFEKGRDLVDEELAKRAVMLVYKEVFDALPDLGPNLNDSFAQESCVRVVADAKAELAKEREQ